MKETETVSSSILTQKPVIFRKCGKLGRKCMRDRVVIKEIGERNICVGVMKNEASRSQLWLELISLMY